MKISSIIFTIKNKVKKGEASDSELDMLLKLLVAKSKEEALTPFFNRIESELESQKQVVEIYS